jgi:Uma2 family endonuclease
MAAATQISVAEYLNTTYRPDRDYVDGEVLERNLGERDHSQPQALIAAYFLARRKEWGLWALTEQRVQVTPNRFRIPDVCVLHADAPYEQVVSVPPLICIEILSKDDSFASIVDRLDDYLAMGVANVWVIDPRLRRGYRYTAEGFYGSKDSVLRTSNSEFAVPLTAIFD